MANPIHETLKIGTIGELLVQLRLLQYDVQAAPPLKDTGNDLIAVKGNCFRAIQVKTTTTDNFEKPPDGKNYHILAVVRLFGEGNDLWLDKTQIFLIKKEDVKNISFRKKTLDTKYSINKDLINRLFS